MYIKEEIGKEVKLIRLREEHLLDVMRWRMSQAVTKYMFTDPVLTYEDQKKWFLKVKESKDSLYWIIVVDNLPIGVICVTGIRGNTGELGWYIGEEGFRGKGIASVVLPNFIDYIFKKRIIGTLISEVFEENEAAIHIYKKNKFVENEEYRYTIEKYDKSFVVEHLELKNEVWESENSEFKKIFIED